MGGVVAAGALALTLAGGTSVQGADAAILHRVAAALTSPPATILHERALVTSRGATEPYELWVESTPPHHYHVLKWGHEGTGTSGAPYDPAAELRSLVKSGRATVDGHPMRSAFMALGDGNHKLPIKADTLRAIGKAPGQTVQVMLLERIESPRKTKAARK